MTPTSQITALAKLDGWVTTNMGTFHKEFPDRVHVVEIDKLGYYLTSRDAIVPLIAKILKKDGIGLVINFMPCLSTLTEAHKKSVSTMGEMGFVSSYAFFILLATPEQLAEALLRACGEWKE